MLLPSERHTPTDLAFWSELEAADRVHGERLARSDRGDQAIAEMRSFARAGPCYVSVSWGKDSVVLAHLLMLSGLRLPLVNVAQHGPQYDRDCPRVRDAFLAAFPDMDYREIVVQSDDLDQRDARHAPSLDEGIRRAAILIGTSRYIGGVRAREGGGRRVRCAVGLSSANSCHPLGWWTDADVFGWLAHNNLPVHPAYAMTGGGAFDRGRIRVSILGGAKGRGGFRTLWEKQYYGDVLRSLEANR